MITLNRAAVEEALREVFLDGFGAVRTYNDTALNDSHSEWDFHEKQFSYVDTLFAALIQKEQTQTTRKEEQKVFDSLQQLLETHNKNERHRTVAETRYWCNQYKLLAQQAIEALAQQSKN